MRKQPVLLLIATNWWPLSARLASVLIKSGCSVSAVCPRGHPLESIQGISEIHSLRGLRFSSQVCSAIHGVRPDLIVPCDDQSTWLLHVLHRSRPELGGLIERSLGRPASYEIIRSRERTLASARELGIRVPETARVESEEEASAWFRCHPPSAVLKLDGSWGGRGVEIVYSGEQAAASFRRLNQPLTLLKSIKRRAVNGDPEALWSWRQRQRPAVTIQELIPGTPANSMVLCWRGEVLAELQVEVLCAQSVTGAALVVRVVEREEFHSAAKLLATRFGLSGFVGLDFMVDPVRSDAYFIEMNPRTTQLGHLDICGRGSLAGALSARLAGTEKNRGGSIPDFSRIAFFPQVFDWNPASPYLRLAWHDVPWEEPRLVRALLEKPWPHRRRLYRLYHSFRPVLRDLAVEFEGAGAWSQDSSVVSLSDEGKIPQVPSPR